MRREGEQVPKDNVLKRAGRKISDTVFDGRPYPVFDALHVFVFAVIAIVLWLPYLVAFAPGIVEIDTVFQIAESLGYGDGSHGPGTYTSLFPLFCVWLIGTLYAIGMFLFSTPWAAIMFSTSVLACTLAFSVSFACCYLSRWNVKVLWRWIIFAFLCLCPIFPLMAVDLGKDTFFVAAFLPLCTCFAELLRRSQSGEKATAPWIILSTISAVIAALVASRGTVIVLACLIVCIFAARRSKQVMAALAVPLCMVLVATAIMSCFVSPALVRDNDSMASRELMSTPMTQVARALVDGTELTEEEHAAFAAFFDVDLAPSLYNDRIADPVKVLIRTDPPPTNAETLEFFKAYMSLGFRAPESYNAAFGDLTRGFWCPGEFRSLCLPRFIPLKETVEDGLVDDYDGMDLPNDFYKMKKMIQKSQVYYTATILVEYCGEHPEFGDWGMNWWPHRIREIVMTLVIRVGEIPVIGLLVQKPLYDLIIPALLLLSILIFGRRKRGLLFALVFPLLFSSLIVFASPVDFTRYAYPCMLLALPYTAIVISQLRALRR